MAAEHCCPACLPLMFFCTKRSEFDTFGDTEKGAHTQTDISIQNKRIVTEGCNRIFFFFFRTNNEIQAKKMK